MIVRSVRCKIIIAPRSHKLMILQTLTLTPRYSTKFSIRHNSNLSQFYQYGRWICASILSWSKIHLYCGLAFDLKRALWRRWQGMDLPKPTLCPDINPPCSHHRVQRCVVMFRKSSQILLHPFCHNCRCGLKQQSRRLRQRGDSGETSRRAAPGLCRSKHSPALELNFFLGWAGLIKTSNSVDGFCVDFPQ